MSNFALFHVDPSLLHVSGWPMRIYACDSMPSITQSKNDILLIPIQLDIKESILSCIQKGVSPHLGKLQHVVLQIDDGDLLLIELWCFILENLLIKFRGLSWHFLLPVASLPFWQKLSIALNYNENVAVFLFISHIPTDDSELFSRANLSQLQLFDWSLELVSSVVLTDSILKNNLSLVKSFLGLTFFAPGHVSPPLISLIPGSVDNVNILLLQDYKSELALYISNVSSSLQSQTHAECVIRDPLQPLRDDLDLEIYDVFQTDHNKYKMYRAAIMQSIAKSTITNLKILVVGPGKGPLVDIAVAALTEANILSYSTVTIVEKNSKCIDILLAKNRQDWNNKVIILHSDVRDLHVENLGEYDIVVSELLGSFACNELSPEIITSIPKGLYHLNTIWIPKEYTNYLQPIYSPLLSQMINRAQSRRPFIAELTKQSYKVLSAFKTLWTFKHDEGPLELSRSKSVTFENLSDPVHGFLGVFTSTLAEDCEIGIHPFQKGTELFCPSWSPIYFPLDTTIIEESLTVSFKRCFDDEKVWYSYAIQGNIHNEYGQRYNISKTSIPIQS